jgi:hypothetical protein
LRFGLLSLRFGLLSLRFGLLSLRFGLLSLRFGLLSLRFGLLSLRFGLLSLRFGLFGQSDGANTFGVEGAPVQIRFGPLLLHQPMKGALPFLQLRRRLLQPDQSMDNTWPI